MEINLYYSLYNEKHPERKQELEKCLDLNMQAGFDKIFLFGEKNDMEYLNILTEKYLAHGDNRMHLVQIPMRAEFQHFFKKGDEYPNAINVCCNADIFFLPETVEQLKSLPWNDKLAVCLSRWDVASFNDDGSVKVANHLNRQDSQDCYVHYGKCRARGFFNIGFPGCDGRMCFEYKNSKYTVFNPSRDIKIYHLHLSKVINYREGGNPNGPVHGSQIVPPPYHFVNSCGINEII